MNSNFHFVHRFVVVLRGVANTLVLLFAMNLKFNFVHQIG